MTFKSKTYYKRALNNAVLYYTIDTLKDMEQKEAVEKDLFVSCQLGYKEVCKWSWDNNVVLDYIERELK